MVGCKGEGFVAVALCRASGGMRRSAGVCGQGARQGASDLVVLTLEEDEAVLFQARLNDVRMLCVGFAFRGRWRTGVREERLCSAVSNQRACLSGRQLQAERRHSVMAASNRCEARLRSFSQSPQQRPLA